VEGICGDTEEPSEDFRVKCPFITNEEATELWEVNYDAVCGRVMTVKE